MKTLNEGNDCFHLFQGDDEQAFRVVQSTDELNITENNVYILKSRSLKVLRTMLSNTEWSFLLLVLFKF